MCVCIWTVHFVCVHLHNAFHAVDKDGFGRFGGPELLYLLRRADFCVCVQLESAFHAFDEDGSGDIDARELFNVKRPSLRALILDLLVYGMPALASLPN